MKLFARWKMVLLLALVFVAGAVTGGVTTHLMMKRALAAAFDFDRWPDRGMRILDDRLQLTADQKIRIRPIQERLAQTLKEHFAASLTETGHILLLTAREIDDELTPAQRAIHAEMKDELRAAFRKHFAIELPDDTTEALPNNDN